MICMSDLRNGVFFYFAFVFWQGRLEFGSVKKVGQFDQRCDVLLGLAWGRLRRHPA
jgi:hypothetical protein